jgi:hypothetical protein
MATIRVMTGLGLAAKKVAEHGSPRFVCWFSLHEGIASPKKYRTSSSKKKREDACRTPGRGRTAGVALGQLASKEQSAGRAGVLLAEV